jgi:spoIIIJ-associated protein
MTTPKDTLTGLLRAMGVDAEVSEDAIAGQTILSISSSFGKELIGPHGDTLHALDHLVKKIVEKGAPSETAEAPHFSVDVNGYRLKQIKDLQTKALMMAERARSFQYDVELSPMSAYERLIVHTTLQNEKNVRTESQGEGRSRRVVIRYAADAAPL